MLRHWQRLNTINQIKDNSNKKKLTKQRAEISILFSSNDCSAFPIGHSLNPTPSPPITSPRFTIHQYLSPPTNHHSIRRRFRRHRRRPSLRHSCHPIYHRCLSLHLLPCFLPAWNLPHCHYPPQVQRYFRYPRRCYFIGRHEDPGLSEGIR